MAASLLPSAQSCAPPPQCLVAQDASLLMLGDCLAHILLLLPLEDAQSARATCQAIRAITLAKGFGRMWRESHVGDATALHKLKELASFIKQLDEQPLETEACTEPGAEWSRILPPRKALRVAAPSDEPMTAAPASLPAAQCVTRTVTKRTKRKEPSRALEDVRAHFAEVDAHELECALVGANDAGW